MRIAVTGAAGFIGRHVVGALAARGHAVVALVHRAPAPPGVEARTLDLAVASSIDAALSDVDALVHAGAYLPRSNEDPDEAGRCLQVNAIGTLEVLRAADRLGLQKVVTLSGNVYRLGVTPVSEDAPVDPSAHATYYLASKACADFYAEHFARDHRLPIVILRPSAVYGPGLRRGMIHTFVARLSAGEPITIADGGRYRADLVHVEDVAATIGDILEGTARGIFNLGAGTTTSTLEIAAALARLLGASAKLLQIEPARGLAPVGFSPLDTTRARRELGWTPRTLEHGLVDYIAWYRSNA